MTYQTLLEILLVLGPEVRKDDVTILIHGQFYPVTETSFASDLEDELDEGHFYLEAE